MRVVVGSRAGKSCREAELGLVQVARQVSHDRSLSQRRPWHVRAHAGHAAHDWAERLAEAWGDKTFGRRDQRAVQEAPVVFGTANVFTLYPAQECENEVGVDGVGSVGQAQTFSAAVCRS